MKFNFWFLVFCTLTLVVKGTSLSRTTFTPNSSHIGHASSKGGSSITTTTHIPSPAPVSKTSKGGSSLTSGSSHTTTIHGVPPVPKVAPPVSVGLKIGITAPVNHPPIQTEKRITTTTVTAAEKPRYIHHTTTVHTGYGGGYGYYRRNDGFGTVFVFFLIGIISFIGSIYLICYNERRSIKDTYYSDILRDNSKIVEVKNGDVGSINQIETAGKVFIISGPVTVNQNAQIPSFDNFPLNGINDVISIKVHVEEFYHNVEVDDYRDEYGYKIRTDVNESWGFKEIHHDPKDKSVFKSQIYRSADVIIGNGFAFNPESLDHKFFGIANRTDVDEIDSNDPCVFYPHDNQQTAQMFYNYFVNAGNYPNIQIFLRGGWVYVLRDKPQIQPNEFSPGNKELFAPGKDLRVKFLLNRGITKVTAVGALVGKGNSYEIVPYNTDIKYESCSCNCCCCFGNEDETCVYKFDQVYEEELTRQDIIRKLEIENKEWTWCIRVTAYILHFIGWYGIFFPVTYTMSYIPFFGQIGAIILIFLAFLLSLASFFLILAIAWLFARPIISILLIIGVVTLIVVAKLGKGHADQRAYGYQDQRPQQNKSRAYQHNQGILRERPHEYNHLKKLESTKLEKETDGDNEVNKAEEPKQVEKKEKKKEKKEKREKKEEKKEEEVEKKEAVDEEKLEKKEKKKEKKKLNKESEEKSEKKVKTEEKKEDSKEEETKETESAKFLR